MRRDEAERVLAGLGEAYERIAAALYAIDGHPAQALLRDAPAGGSTGARAVAVRADLELLWARFTYLGGLLSRARELSARRRIADAESVELEQLLDGLAVAVDAAGLPLDGPGPGPGSVVSRMRSTELAGQLEQGCARLADQLSEVDAAWTAVAGRLARAASRVDELGTLADRVGEPAAIAEVRRALAQVSSADAVDPLAAAPGGRLTAAAAARFDRLDAKLAAAGTRLSELDTIRAAYPQRLAQVRDGVGQVERAEAAAAQAYQRVVEKISDPGLAPLPASAPVLRNRIVALEELRAAGRWGRLADDLGTLADSVQRSLQRAEALRALADGLLERRDELRGRLSAYQQKAARIGLVEDARLAACFDKAQDLLFTAPCDLRAGTRAVHEYQQTLAELIQGK